MSISEGTINKGGLNRGEKSSPPERAPCGQGSVPSIPTATPEMLLEELEDKVEEFHTLLLETRRFLNFEFEPGRSIRETVHKARALAVKIDNALGISHETDENSTKEG